MEPIDIILVAHYSEKTLVETRQAYNILVHTIAETTQKYNSDLIKNINKPAHEKCMGLEEYISKTLNTIGEAYTSTKDFLNYEKAKIYHLDAEKYNYIGDKETYTYLKKKCVETFEMLETEEFIKKFKETMGSYLTEKPSK